MYCREWWHKWTGTKYECWHQFISLLRKFTWSVCGCDCHRRRIQGSHIYCLPEHVSHTHTHNCLLAYRVMLCLTSSRMFHCPIYISSKMIGFNQYWFCMLIKLTTDYIMCSGVCRRWGPGHYYNTTLIKICDNLWTSVFVPQYSCMHVQHTMLMTAKFEIHGN